MGVFTLFTLFFDSAGWLFECKNSFVKVRGLLCGYSETEGIAPLFRAFGFTNHLSPITYQLPAITYFRCFLMAPKANMTGKTPFVKVRAYFCSYSIAQMFYIDKKK